MRRFAPVLVVPLLLVAACGSSSDEGADKGVTATGTVTVKGTDSLKFSPSVVNTKVGPLVLTFSNTGLVPHNLVFDDSSLGRTGTVDGKKSEALKLVFNKAGTFAFTCTFHPGMKGKVVVS